MGQAQRVIVNGVISGWKPDTSKVPQGLILGPMLLIVFINYLDSRTYWTLGKFANDTKLGVVDSRVEALQRDLERLESCAIINHMKFNKSKSQILHLGCGNPGYTYKWGNKRQQSNPIERDLWIWVNGKLNMRQQCALAAKRANQVLGCIRHSIPRWSREVTVLL